MRWWQEFDHIIEQNASLAALTTMRVGGVARWLAKPNDVDQLSRVLQLAMSNDVSVRILGGGSNLLISDEPWDGIVICLPRTSFGACVIDDETNQLKVGAALPLAALLKKAQQAGLAGLETLSGIPGSVAGAVYMNAGTAQEWIGSRVITVSVVTMSGEIKMLTDEELKFGYRHSNLDEMVITEIILRLDKDEPSAIAERARLAVAEKAKHQPLGNHSAGCIFKNPPNDSAGRLIDTAGCKGWHEGDAVVSDVHANFIVNSASASYADVMRLIERVQAQVFSVHQVELQLEVKVW
jgi:UDP-N-acetylmuramate dehydrogenase